MSSPRGKSESCRDVDDSSRYRNRNRSRSPYRSEAKKNLDRSRSRSPSARNVSSTVDSDRLDMSPARRNRHKESTDAQIKGNYKRARSETPTETINSKLQKTRSRSSDSSNSSGLSDKEKSKSKSKSAHKRKLAKKEKKQKKKAKKEKKKAKKEEKAKKKEMKYRKLAMEKHLSINATLMKLASASSQNATSSATGLKATVPAPIKTEFGSSLKRNSDGTQRNRMAPMTKTEWEKKQSVIRREVSPTTGRVRLIKGDGEILEEIVSKERHKNINKSATAADGQHFQNALRQNHK